MDVLSFHGIHHPILSDSTSYAIIRPSKYNHSCHKSQTGVETLGNVEKGLLFFKRQCYQINELHVQNLAKTNQSLKKMVVS